MNTQHRTEAVTGITFPTFVDGRALLETNVRRDSMHGGNNTPSSPFSYPLTLCCHSYRKKYFLNIYAFGVYVATPTLLSPSPTVVRAPSSSGNHGGEEISLRSSLDLTQPLRNQYHACHGLGRMFRMEMARAVSGKDIADAFTRAMKPRLDKYLREAKAKHPPTFLDPAEVKRSFAEFKSQFVARNSLKKGDQIEIVWLPRASLLEAQQGEWWTSANLTTTKDSHGDGSDDARAGILVSYVNKERLGAVVPSGAVSFALFDVYLGEGPICPNAATAFHGAVRSLLPRVLRDNATDNCNGNGIASGGGGGSTGGRAASAAARRSRTKRVRSRL